MPESNEESAATAGNEERIEREKFTELLNDTADKLRSNEKNVYVMVKESADLENSNSKSN